ncbi:MAG: glucosamine-6-phosphate deaminase [Phycisphaerae bacterium]
MLRMQPVPVGKAFTALERIPTTVCVTDREAAVRVAGIIAATVRTRNERGQSTVLGLATGHTPIGVYRELIRMHREEKLDLSRVITFNLDEYYPMPPESIQSYRRWMKENFFDHVNIPAASIHIPDGTVPETQVDVYCHDYEARIKAAGGIDVQILGIGRTGHIGFNEPGSSPESPTRLVTLDPVTRRDAAADFFGEANVPRRAITMGVGTILKAARVILMAFGEHKASIIRKAVEDPVSDTVAASFLQNHPQAELVVDSAAGAALTRVATPWLLGEIDWNAENVHRAVIWLSLKTGKSLLKLDSDDYDTHHLASLARRYDSVDDLNRLVYRSKFGTIAHYGSLPDDKRMLCFSPHPDDDVISMGGTLTRLVKRGNEVHVAYMTSGNIAVFDDYAFQMMDFWCDLNRVAGGDTGLSHAFWRRVDSFLKSKEPGQVDIPELQEVKSRLRRSEALAACRWMGIPAERAHFLDLPFYKTGEVRKRPIGPEDVQIVLELIRRVRPQWIFVAGELSDPHGTHRLCAEAIYAALKECSEDERPETVWLYRGAWQEWDPDVIDMAVPLSRSELKHKIFGIFKHQSQKDKALFPGPYDDREFWQRAEARNTDTAETYNQLGLPEHHAMEAFVRWQG